MSIPEVAEQMGHSPAMTLSTYTHVIPELKGLPAIRQPSSSTELALPVAAWWTSPPPG